jgi:hypothetical protein
MAFALRRFVSILLASNTRKTVRFRVQFVQETTTVFLRKYTRETPGLVLHWLHVLDLHEKDITRLCTLDLKRTGEVVDLGQVYITDVVCGVVVPDLAACPVDTFDLDHLSVFDGAGEWDWSKFSDERIGRWKLGYSPSGCQRFY